jgi:hypothetical protein
LAALVALAPLAALAHGPRVGVHGGQQMAAGSFHVEVVASDKTLTVYLADHAAHEIPTAGFKGVAFIDVDDKTLTIPLAPAGGNKLSGAAEAPLSADFKGIVRFTTQTGSTTEAKF